MPSFESNKNVILQPLDTNVYINYNFTTCSSSGSNDGFLPYGTTLASVETTAWKFADENNRDITLVEDTELVVASTLSHPIVTIRFDYPTTNGAGYYKIRMLLTLTNNTTLEADFNRIIARDL